MFRDDRSDYQNADYGNLDHIYGSRADIYIRQDKLYGQDSPYRNPDSIMGNQDNIFGDPGNLFRDPGNLFGNQDSCYENQDNIFGTQDSSYGNKDSISGTLDSCYGNQDNRTQNKCYQSQDLNSGNHSDGLINMMKRIDLETKKIEKGLYCTFFYFFWGGDVLWKVAYLTRELKPWKMTMKKRRRKNKWKINGR